MMPPKKAGGANESHHDRRRVRAEARAQKRFRQLDERARPPVTGRGRCQQFDVLLPVDEPNKVLFVEAWRDQTALDVHSKVPRMTQNRQKYTPWLSDRKATRCLAD
jgi:quinol monooxygenase YgiN